MQDVNETLGSLGEQTAIEQVECLIPQVYDALHDLAERRLRDERVNHTLQPTALVHEVFLRLVDQSRVNWNGRTHFFAVAAEAMRRVLVDHARGKGRAKRGGGWDRVLLDEAIHQESSDGVNAIALSDSIEKLSQLDADQARVVQLRFFAGMSVDEVAHIMGCSKRRVEALWTHAKAWLRSELAADQDR